MNYKIKSKPYGYIVNVSITEENPVEKYDFKKNKIIKTCDLYVGETFRVGEKNFIVLKKNK